MALSADRDYSVQGQSEVFHGILTASVTYYKGGIVQFDASTGLVKKPADVAGEFPVGVLKKGYVAPASPAMHCEIETGKVWLPFATAAQTDVGDWIYASADDTLTKTPPTNAGPAGIVVDFKTGFVCVDFRKGAPKGAVL
jgi:hypothetical protein